MTEDQHQAALFKWANTQRHTSPELNLLFAIPNGGHRHKAVAAKLQATGVKAGVPDMFLPVARGGHNGLWIELKAEKGRTSEKQVKWLSRLSEQGYLAIVCFGWVEAKDKLEEYLA